MRELREEAGVDREQLANEVGSTKQYISHLENGVKKNPAFDLVERLAKALGTECTAFAADGVAEQEEPPTPKKKPRK
ncbi:helix-turn-helix transcriptional regulator [Limnoglobus roseus]|nr:helix-turn-helix transcriptional regulator [Limnoglobus roseus]